MIVYPCGCRNDVSSQWGVTFCVSKCAFHVQERKNQPVGKAYYQSLGCIDEAGVIQSDQYNREFVDAVGSLPVPPAISNKVLEIGCGPSVYCPMLTQAGYIYTGMEPDLWAAERTRQQYGVDVWLCYFEECQLLVDEFGMVFAAHTLEHLIDAPIALTRIHSSLCAQGLLVLIVPDDSDPVNPDHLWFFSERTLRALLEKTGFIVERFAIRRLKERENFLYCVARKGV